ncbi:signal recognition particle, SRP9/SRP14 subunit [Testicularia cyperi]|uniref:Signal recognition particle, SRP9/SRP14 subunit n=1 Tax=Testicularia cyperi TaxID=1882483 RepID=A0A317XUG9_9BASI|nr:signal recognition particle, SRP9/SRP14 subunit [Testicularia cyperi]
MVYIQTFPDFQAQSIALYQRNPSKTRYLVKSRPNQQTLTLKVTDDTTTLKFRTKSTNVIARLEVFNKAMLLAMAGHPRPLEHASAPPASQSQASGSAAGAQHSNANNSNNQQQNKSANQNQQSSSSSSNKKKKKKGKK